jgi:hypothetical protein
MGGKRVAVGRRGRPESGRQSAQFPQADQIMSTLTASELLPDPGRWRSGSERRRSRRAPLQWTVYLACNGAGHPFRTRTRDISNIGFYCLVDRAVRPSDVFECDIVVPTHTPQDPDDVAYLRCRARAVRVEKIGDGTEFGLACRIEDYCLVYGADIRLRA